ncbi:hypothetical protein BDV37DRAFT_7139 [Aspergillus pseudonomiae]|uniref:Uncharacterized protein n=1 Tax=Aspergillus pseudonomiae TaxID=1506151 RepID=A0A5N7D088_9EURO|nr:uncharacterized protein BDV37DRAFT_7139 [Aspergillus pseudonomiae]KAE8399258.1 hypothetical protein BDV37DRAFT_7139 [Aspergillus pseudonomiae]
MTRIWLSRSLHDCPDCDPGGSPIVRSPTYDMGHSLVLLIVLSTVFTRASTGLGLCCLVSRPGLNPPDLLSSRTMVL